ncbi:hypothetical protein [Costertonia aggregata]|uniref:Uncharacterized protein n=1 Tax=Costertonia aggregata TaxID=343403 RepID=A0A7H9AUI1_9FLAO|nr:hypothetical protein [Costertonia aggregata]QLG47138.1 hypothetical protein HYG79_17825 [Costertonia aggregata]
MRNLGKISSRHFILFFILILFGAELQAQFGRGGGFGRGGFGNGRQRNPIPQAQDNPKPPEPKTAEQIVDEEMPSIIEALSLNAFEAAVMSSTLKKYVQERIELQILELPADKMREAYEKITKRQDEELKVGLPPEKYEAFVELQKNGVNKTLKNKKREKKKKKKKSKT